MCGNKVSVKRRKRLGSIVDLQHEKRYNPRDKTLTFVDRPDEIDPYSDESPRALMSCGHAVTPGSLTGWCRSLLEQGQHTFRCPVLVGKQQCQAEWKYKEVRKMALLTIDERKYFEERMSSLAAEKSCEFKLCPGCGTAVERNDLDNLSVSCPICTAAKGCDYEFCWQCLQPRKGSERSSTRCENQGCTSRDLEVLRTCKTIDLPKVTGATECPSVRACPTCGMMLEHDQTNCKNIECRRCKVEFCFICLKLKIECSKTSGAYDMCPGGPAPRQTVIPKWHRTA